MRLAAIAFAGIASLGGPAAATLCSTNATGAGCEVAQSALIDTSASIAAVPEIDFGTGCATRAAGAACMMAPRTLQPVASERFVIDEEEEMACLTSRTGAGCVTVPVSSRKPPLENGLVLERGKHNLLMNVDYYGLEPVRDGWVYMEIDEEIYRVDWSTHAIVGHVGHRRSLF
ncbi:hypothetical protein AADZ90_016640 [Aestuariibius sp. 2305UL40-4]|uniref:hypothetical protein n=1 Tax=Aestuariibius violaceus TaxID=3234132 RepID=UPI00345E1793